MIETSAPVVSCLLKHTYLFLALFGTAYSAVDVSTELVFLLKREVSVCGWLYIIFLTYFSGKTTITVTTGLLES